MGGDAAAFPAGAVASVAAAGRDGVGAGGGSPPVGWAVPIRTTCPPPEAITSVEEKKGRGGGGCENPTGRKKCSRETDEMGQIDLVLLDYIASIVRCLVRIEYSDCIVNVSFSLFETHTK
jgi:hypothetical protein